MVKTRKGGGSTKKAAAKPPSTPVSARRSSVATPSSAVSKGGTTKEERGVPKYVRKQLARDIHQKGGIQEFDRQEPQGLDKLLNNPNRTEYGERGDPLRKQIANLVTNQWKVWPTEKYYDKVVIPFVIQDNDQLAEAPASASKKKSSNKKSSTTTKTRDTSPDSSIDSNNSLADQSFRNQSTPFDSFPITEIATVVEEPKKKTAAKMTKTTMHGGILTRKPPVI